MGKFTGNQTFILGTLLPMLTKDIIYGGSPPYIVYVNEPAGMFSFEQYLLGFSSGSRNLSEGAR